MVSGPGSATVPATVAYIAKRCSTIVTSTAGRIFAASVSYAMVVASDGIVRVIGICAYLPRATVPLVVIVSGSYITRCSIVVNGAIVPSIG